MQHTWALWCARPPLTHACSCTLTRRAQVACELSAGTSWHARRRSGSTRCAARSRSLTQKRPECTSARGLSFTLRLARTGNLSRLGSRRLGHIKKREPQGVAFRAGRIGTDACECIERAVSRVSPRSLWLCLCEGCRLVLCGVQVQHTAVGTGIQRDTAADEPVFVSVYVQ